MTRLVCIAAFVAAAVVAVTRAQGPGRTNSNWPTIGADAQRTSWMRNDVRLSASALAPGAADKTMLQLLWKTKLDAQPSRPSALTQPLLLQNIISHKGFKALAFVATNADVVYAIDYDLNRVYWRQPLSTAARAGARSSRCAAGAPGITRAASVVPPGLPGARGGPAGRGPTGPPPANRGGINTSNLPINSAVYAVSSGGMLHFLNPHIGQDIQPAIKFLPAAANVAGLIHLDNVLYAAITDNCGGAAPGVWAIDLANDAKTVTRWESGAGGVAGTTGPAFDLDGTVFVTASKAVVALEPKSLRLRDQFTAPTAFSTAPVAFRFKQRDLLAVGNSDGRIYLLDAKSLAGAPVGSSPEYGPLPETPHALATWEDTEGTRWILAPSRTAIVAFKVVDEEGTLSLENGWTSREIGGVAAPTILNDIVLALGGGRTAVLYAFDGRTGKELWNSGTAITASASTAPSAGDSQIYISANDGTLYAFGLPQER